jgi:hypothetical protein
MSKKQTRRSISVSGVTHDRLKDYCELNNTTCSAVVEDLVRKFLGMEERAPNLKKPPVPRVERAVAPTPPPSRTEQIREAVARQDAAAAKTVTLTTPVLEKDGNWKEVDGRKIAPTDEQAKKNGTPLPDLASKIFTF